MNQPEITTQSFGFVLKSVDLTKRSKWLIKQNLRKHAVPFGNNLNALLCDITYAHFSDSHKLLLVSLHCSQVPIQRVAGFVKRLTTVSLQSQANGTLALLSYIKSFLQVKQQTTEGIPAFLIMFVFFIHKPSVNDLLFRTSVF